MHWVIPLFADPCLAVFGQFVAVSALDFGLQGTENKSFFL